MNVTEEEINRRWVDLSDRAVFRLTGPDSVRYLNGQVTNDVTKGG
jgi:folate-binding Fe-S cluster repair protein YgfZ